MSIEIANESGMECHLAPIVSIAEFAIKAMGLHPECELEIMLVDEDRMSELHVEWMDLPGPTDVLSFPMDELTPDSAADGPGIIGDIVLCPAFAAEQAKTGLDDELALLQGEDAGAEIEHPGFEPILALGVNQGARALQFDLWKDHLVALEQEIRLGVFEAQRREVKERRLAQLL